MSLVLWSTLFSALFPSCAAPSAEIQRAREKHNVEFLTSLVSEKDTPGWVVADACRALGEIKDPASVPALLTVINNTSKTHGEYAAAAHALGRIGDRKMMQPLLNFMERASHTEARYWTIWALGQLHHPTIRALFESLTDDPDPLVAGAVAHALLTYSGNSQ